MHDTQHPSASLPLAVSIRSAAGLVSLSEGTIDQAIRAGLLPVRRHGNRTLIRTCDLMAWLDSMPTGRPPPPPQLEGRRTGRPPTRPQKMGKLRHG